MTTAQDPETHAYVGFISYRHREPDRVLAQWLVDAIESYETPDPLVREGYPRKLGTVFRDDDEMKAEPELTQAIKRALWASKYLLVVCSPETPKSTWVRAEISLFQHWGRGDRIIPILIEGSPAQSFPPELIRTEVIGHGPDAAFRTIEPRGPNLTPEQGVTEEEQKEHALLTIAATALGCAFSALRNREEERVRKLTSVAFYRDMVRRWGAPGGVDEIAPEIAGRREFSYRFESRGGRVMRVVRINGFGFPVADDYGTPDVCQWDVAWRDSGRVDTVTARDRLGNVKLVERFNADGTVVDLALEDDSASAMGGVTSGLGFTFAITDPMASRKSTIVRHLLTLDASGHVIARRFCRDGFNTPEADTLGHYGQGYEVNHAGQVVREWALDATGAPMTQRNGVRWRLRGYSPEGDRVLECFEGEDGLPTLSSEFVAREVWTLDEVGNFIEGASFGLDGLPAQAAWGSAGGKVSPDDHGNPTLVEYFAADGQPSDSTGTSALSLRHDERGNRIELCHLDQNGNPLVGTLGYAREKRVFDEKNNLIECRFLGTHDEPVLHKDGYAWFRHAYDARGNVVEEITFDVNDKPVVTSEGVARSIFAYDRRGNCVETAGFGIDGEPTLHKDGFARFTQAYDARGNCIKVAYFGVDGKPILHKDGFARFTQAYDARGNCIEWAYFGVDGEPILHKDGYARVTQAYDARGNQVDWAGYDVDGHPRSNKYGVARAICGYDAAGNCVEWAGFGIQGEPTPHKDGYARSTIVHDPRGNSTEVRYFGINGQPILIQEGYFRDVRSYDSRGNRISAHFLGLDDQRVARRGKWDPESVWAKPLGEWQDLIVAALHTPKDIARFVETGFATVERTMDARGHEVTRWYQAPDGSPVAGPEGFSRLERTVDALGNPLLITPMLEDGSAPLRLSFTHTPRRLVDTVTFIDPQDQPAMTPLGFASLAFVYDNRFQHIATKYLDDAGAVISEEPVEG